MQVLAISVDDKEDSARMKRELGLTFPLLSDGDEAVTRRFAQAQLKQSELDPQQIEQTIRKGEPGKRVSRDQAEFPVSETPTLIINNEVAVGAIEYGDLKRIVEEKLAPKEARRPQ